MDSKPFNAPWGKTLRYVSAFCVTLGFIIPGAIYFTDKSGQTNWLLVGGFYWTLLLGAALFIIRSYTLEPNALAFRRLLWTTRLPLSGLQSAEFTPDVMRRSLRLWGNGGMLSITGWYRNRALGNYRAFVTDLNRTVVLRFPARTVVVSPADPERFVAEISKFAFRTA